MGPLRNLRVSLRSENHYLTKTKWFSHRPAGDPLEERLHLGTRVGGRSLDVLRSPVLVKDAGRALVLQQLGFALEKRAPGNSTPTDSRGERLPKFEEEVEMQIRRIREVLNLVGVAVLVSVAATAVAAQDVKYNFMPGTDFSKYHTYKWVAIEGGAHPNQIVDAEIKQAVDSQLASKGMTKTDGEKADLYVAYQIAVDQEKQWNAYGMGGGLRWGGMGSATSSTINVGTLVLDLYDPSTKQLVWTGNATKTIDPSSNQQKNQKNLNKAMAKLLKNYPPKSK